MPNVANSTEERVPPVQVEQSGNNEGAIWQRETEDGVIHTLTRSYRQQENRERRATFFRDDLPILGTLLERAYAWLLFQEKSNEAENSLETAGSRGVEV